MENIANVETATTETNAGGTTQPINSVEGKMYSQADMDKIIGERLARERKSYQSKYMSQVKDLQMKLASYEREVAMSKYQIDDEYADYVNFKVAHMTNDKVSYEDALNEFMSGEGARYAKAQKGVSIPRPQNTNGGVETEMQKLIREKYGKKIS